METGVFILARWVLTFGAAMAFALYQLSSLRKERARVRVRNR